jgi:hypothetical protein
MIQQMVRMAMTPSPIPRRVSRRPLRILVVPAKPEGRVDFVATLGRAVEDWVVPHQKLQPTGRGVVGVEYGTLVADERTEARGLRQVADNVRSGGAREMVYDRRYPRLGFLGDPFPPKSHHRLSRLIPAPLQGRGYPARSDPDRVGQADAAWPVCPKGVRT